MIEKRISLVEFHTADEAFTTGTMGEITPISKIDGRLIGSDLSEKNKITQLIQNSYKLLTETEGFQF